LAAAAGTSVVGGCAVTAASPYVRQSEGAEPGSEAFGHPGGGSGDGFAAQAGVTLASSGMVTLTPLTATFAIGATEQVGAAVGVRDSCHACRSFQSAVSAALARSQQALTSEDVDW